MSDSSTLYNPVLCCLLVMLYATFVLDRANKSTLLSQDIVLLFQTGPHCNAHSAP